MDEPSGQPLHDPRPDPRARGDRAGDRAVPVRRLRGLRAVGVGGGCVDLDGPGFGDALGVVRDLWFDRVALGPDEPAALDDFAEDVDRPTRRPPPPRRTRRARRSPPPPEDRPTPTRGRRSPRCARSAHRLVRRGQGSGPLLPAPDDPAPAVQAVPGRHGVQGRRSERRGPPGGGRRPMFSWSPWTSAVSEQQHLLQPSTATSSWGRSSTASATPGSTTTRS